MENDYEETDSNGRWSPGLSKALMASVVIITAIAIWLVPVDDKQAPQLPPLSSAPESAEDLLLPPPPGGIATVTNGGDRARAFIYDLRAGGAQPDVDVVFAEAERLQGEGNREDAHLLYRFAARHGQAQAALILGTQADPAFHATASGYLPEPEPAQAYKWYSVATTAGNEEAAVRLQDLHKLVQQNAANGDEQARRLLLQWQ
jgi:hypothetical protein